MLVRLIPVVAMLVLLASAAAAEPEGAPPAAAQPTNLLAGKAPLRSSGVRNAEALTDGTAAREGDGWKTQLTARFEETESFVVYDLGAEREVGYVWLQADADDTYDVELSTDDRSYALAWRARLQPDGGLRARSSEMPSAHARYVKLHASSGDRRFAVSEIQAFGAVAPGFAPDVSERAGVSLDRRFRDKTLLCGLLLLVPLLLTRHSSSRRWILLTLLAPAIGAWQVAEALARAWPSEARDVSLVRATVAGVAAVAVARYALAPARFAAARAVVLGTLAVCGALGLLAFYNLGQPQFYDVQAKKSTFAHYLDLRQYYPTAKYFRELGYRRIYEADVVAYTEDNRSASLDSGLPMRDLGSLRMSTLGEQKSRIATVKSRFSPERWQDYKSDARWFRGALGTSAYLDTMHDFGGNATPVWMGIAYALFSFVEPSARAFTLTGLLDLGLLLVMFWAIARTFGVRSMLVTMVVFGANDFIMYGTNWGGATLRHDWLAYLGLAACAMKRQRWLLGGALLGLSTMIRAFPALALCGVLIPALWRLAEDIVRTRRLPRLREILRAEQPTVRVVAAWAVTLAVTFGLSLLVFPLDAWADWYIKVNQLSIDPHPAAIGLRSLIAGWEGDQPRILRSRSVLYVAAICFYVALIAIAARRKRPEQAALLGMILLPVVMYPANYYIHFVFLLPLLAEERAATQPLEPWLTPTDAALWITLLGMCVAQYLTVLVDDLGVHFYQATALLFAAVTALLVLLVRAEVAASGWLTEASIAEHEPVAAAARDKDEAA